MLLHQLLMRGWHRCIAGVGRGRGVHTLSLGFDSMFKLVVLAQRSLQPFEAYFAGALANVA